VCFIIYNIELLIVVDFDLHLVRVNGMQSDGASCGITLNVAVGIAVKSDAGLHVLLPHKVCLRSVWLLEKFCEWVIRETDAALSLAFVNIQRQGGDGFGDDAGGCENGRECHRTLLIYRLSRLALEE
jgi:hypothetical protein